MSRLNRIALGVVIGGLLGLVSGEVVANWRAKQVERRAEAERSLEVFLYFNYIEYELAGGLLGAALGAGIGWRGVAVRK